MNDKILLVDDNEDLLMITRIILKGQGYNTILATTTEEATRKIKIHQPTLVLLDVCICNEDGRDFCCHLKNDPETCNLRVILMSGYDAGCGHDIADDFLPKPFNYDELIAKVERQMTAVA
jgi:DNA-binding response OmpR family regulator